MARNSAIHVVLACRNPTLGKEAATRLRHESGHAVTFLPLDLADQQSVRRFYKVFCEAPLPPLHAIICNAGMQNVGTPQTTAEGYETGFAINHLGHYLLVRLLLSELAQDGRISFVSSGTHDPKAGTRIPPPVYTDADSAAHDLEGGQRNGLRRYALSKLCNLLCAYELHQLLKSSGDARLASIKVNSFNPGVMAETGLARTFPWPIRILSRYVMPVMEKDVQNARISAELLVAMTLGHQAAPGGRYFSRGEAITLSDDSYNPEFQRELWASSARMTGLPGGLAES